MDAYYGGISHRVDISWGSSFRDTTWEQCYYGPFLEDPALADVLPGSDAHFEYMFTEGGPPKALVDTFGPRMAPSLDIMANVRAEWRSFSDFSGSESNFESGSESGSE